MAGKKQPRQRDRGVGDAPDRVHQIVIVHAIIAADEHRMNEERRLVRRARLPERIEIGIVELAELTLGLGPDHHAVKTLSQRLFQHLRGEDAALQRHAGQRGERGQFLDVLQRAFVHEAAPIRALLGRQLVAENIEPASDQLAIDACLAEPFLALVEIDQKRPDRPRRREAAENEAHAGLVVDHLDRREKPALRREPFEKGSRDVVAMRVDDQWNLLIISYVLRSTVAIRSLNSAGVIGSSAIFNPNAASASLTAQEMAAGAPR